MTELFQMLARAIHWSLLVGFSVPPIMYSVALQDPVESERQLEEVNFLLRFFFKVWSIAFRTAQIRYNVYDKCTSIQNEFVAPRALVDPWPRSVASAGTIARANRVLRRYCHCQSFFCSFSETF